MKAKRAVSRRLVEQRDGQRRWDDAYQFLLRWVMEGSAGTGPEPPHEQEEEDGNCLVCARIDESATAEPDD